VAGLRAIDGADKHSHIRYCFSRWEGRVDGEVAQLAALAISANHRIIHPDDPMPWFAGQRAFDRCGRIGFHAAKKRRFGRHTRVPVAETPLQWLERLAASSVCRVVLAYTRQDDEIIPGETLPDRIAAGFAGGGSLWTISTETSDGSALAWRPGWRVAFPKAEEGRIWSVDYLAEPSVPCQVEAGVDDAAHALQASLEAIRRFALEQHYGQVAGIFTSALALLDGAPDPRPVPRPAGPADTLSDPARRLLFAAQRAWIFDNLSLWRDQDFSHDLWKRYAALSEALYSSVTAALAAAVNSTVSECG
jgi:hypothetical protein